jgi:hypothetical protein
MMNSRGLHGPKSGSQALAQGMGLGLVAQIMFRFRLGRGQVHRIVIKRHIEHSEHYQAILFSQRKNFWLCSPHAHDIVGLQIKIPQTLLSRGFHICTVQM